MICKFREEKRLVLTPSDDLRKSADNLEEIFL
jgi:hypothetical protein